MDNRNDGGAAFPRDGVSNNGMSLRDWFAGMALQGLLVAGYSRSEDPSLAFRMANEMIETKERSK